MRRTIAFIVGAASLLALEGCASPSRVEPVPDSAWASAPRTSSPVRQARHEDARSREAPTDALTRDQVRSLCLSKDPDEAIWEIDRHPLAFKLDAENLAWLDERVPTEVTDYLRKRAKVDWEALRRESREGNDPGPIDDYAQAPAPAPAPVQERIVYRTEYVEVPQYPQYETVYVAPCYGSTYYGTTTYYDNYRYGRRRSTGGYSYRASVGTNGVSFGVGYSSGSNCYVQPPVVYNTPPQQTVVVVNSGRGHTNSYRASGWSSPQQASGYRSGPVTTNAQPVAGLYTPRGSAGTTTRQPTVLRGTAAGPTSRTAR